MFKRILLPVWIGILILSGMFLMGQDCAAQDDPCNPDPCPGIQNAVEGTCTLIPGGVCHPDDFSCNCQAGFTWQQTTHTCQGGPSSALPDTGIEECYDNAQVITCPAPGEPFFGQDAQYVTNPMSFTANGDVTVTDNVTGLMWQREDDDIGRTWADAITYCENLNFSGCSNWRLPDEYELQSIVDYSAYDPVIDMAVFPGTDSSEYWSSSVRVSDTTDAWGVTFRHGNVVGRAKSGTHFVRCVCGERSGRSFTENGDGTVTDNVTGLTWQREDDDTGRTWAGAMTYCEGLELGGSSDWRMPDVKELRSIVDNESYSPAIATSVFPGTKPSPYWSSSTDANDNSSAWAVYFLYGYVDDTNKTNTRYVRCVR